MKNKYMVVLICFVIVLFSNIAYCENFKIEETTPKTIILILDKLDFSVANEIVKDKDGVGIINNRTASLYKSDAKESYFFTVATGRRMKVNGNLFKGIKKKEGQEFEIIGYDNILTNLLDNNSILKKNRVLFGEYFRKNGIFLGYMGDGISSILTANENGIIEYGYKDITYERRWLREKTEKLLSKADILIVDFNGNSKVKDKKAISLLKEYVGEFEDNHILMISPNISKSMSEKFNDTLGLAIYKSPSSDGGLLSSRTTKREGIITNLDIFPHVASIYGLEGDGFIGNKFELYLDNEPVETVNRNFNQYLNLNIIKYIFHFLVIVGELYIIYFIAIKKRKTLESNNRCEIIINSIVSSILFSLILGVIDFQKVNLAVYTIIIIILSIVTSYIFNRKEIKGLPVLAGLLNLVIIYSVIFNDDIIYNSYIGYNNILAGGRFYGLNNGILGVFLGSGIVFYFSIRRMLESSVLGKIVMLTIFPAMIVALSGNYGANTGGFITSIALFIIVIYYESYESLDLHINSKDKNKSNKVKNIMKVFLLVAVGVIVIGITFYFDTINGSSHVGSMINRTLSFGYIEVLDLFFKKIKQLLFMIVVPPWSVILIGQLYFMFKVYRIYSHKRNIKRENMKTEITKTEKIKETINKKNIEKLNGELSIDFSIKGEIYILFLTSVIGLLINDTGVIAFTYMNTFIIGKIGSLHNA